MKDKSKNRGMSRDTALQLAKARHYRIRTAPQRCRCTFVEVDLILRTCPIGEIMQAFAARLSWTEAVITNRKWRRTCLGRVDGIW